MEMINASVRSILKASTVKNVNASVIVVLMDFVSRIKRIRIAANVSKVGLAPGVEK